MATEHSSLLGHQGRSDAVIRHALGGVCGFLLVVLTLVWFGYTTDALSATNIRMRIAEATLTLGAFMMIHSLFRSLFLSLMIVVLFCALWSSL